MSTLPSALVIDDDPHVCEILEKLLNMRGFVVEIAYDGLTGLNLGAERPYDLVITDICMPGMEGVGVLRELKRMHPDLKVITMSGTNNSEEYLHTSETFGADAILYKPIMIEPFREAMKSIGF